MNTNACLTPVCQSGIDQNPQKKLETGISNNLFLANNYKKRIFLDYLLTCIHTSASSYHSMRLHQKNKITICFLLPLFEKVSV